MTQSRSTEERVKSIQLFLAHAITYNQNVLDGKF